MLENVLQKIIRLFRPDRQLQMKLCAVLLLAVLISILGKYLKAQDRTLVKVRAEKDLVLQIPAMEKKINEMKYEALRKARSLQKAEALRNLSPDKQIAEIERVLEGTSYRDGVYQAVIDGEVYSTGSEIGDFTITAINMESITLENKDTREIERLKFPDNGFEEAIRQVK
ncbi:MAG: hypothetical protein JW847_00525 [Candidatus Omnitrophica bacterium]|nr:hypothetical protein [Candidatus Omnitrophota bacterium]